MQRKYSSDKTEKQIAASMACLGEFLGYICPMNIGDVLGKKCFTIPYRILGTQHHLGYCPINYPIFQYKKIITKLEHIQEAMSKVDESIFVEWEIRIYIP